VGSQDPDTKEHWKGGEQELPATCGGDATGNSSCSFSAWQDDLGIKIHDNKGREIKWLPKSWGATKCNNLQRVESWETPSWAQW